MDEIGAQLREARMRARIDINEVETRTKIRAKYLRAMENEEWGLLPGEVYVRSFLRTYGDFLGLDSRQLLDDYRRRYESPTDHEPPPIAPLGRERRERTRGPGRRSVPPWLIVGVVLVAVAVVLYVVGTGNGPSGTHTAAPRAAQTSTHPATTRRRRPKAVHRAAAKPKTVRLSLVPTSADGVWICLVNGAGKPLIDGQIYDLGQTIPTETAAKLKLLLGNASVTMKVNGVTVPVAASSGPIGYQLTPTGHSLLSAGDEPSCNP